MKKTNFKDYKLSEELLKAISLLNFANPTKVQEQAIPSILDNKDIIVKSQTGSGKTAAFAIPICELVDWDENKPQALILTPTRELAIQVRESYVHRIGRTGRANKLGKAITFVSQKETKFLKDIEEYIEKEIPLKVRPDKETISDSKEEFEEKINTRPEIKETKGAELDKEILKLHINAGKKTKMRASDIVGTLCNIEGITKKGLLYSILLGVLTKGIFKLSLDTSMTLVGVATSTILMYLAPVWVSIMALIFFKEKLRGYQTFALVLNLIGCILMVTGGNFTDLNISGLGLALGVLAGFLYGLSTIIGKVGSSGDNPATMVFYMMVFSSITTAIFAKPWQHLDLFTNSSFLFWAIISGVFAGGVANICFLTGLSMGIDASKTTIIASIEVVIATLAGVFLLNESINFIGLLGIAIMLGSIFLMNMNTGKDPEEVSEKDGVSAFDSL